MKIITYVDLQGCYHNNSPVYDAPERGSVIIVESDDTQVVDAAVVAEVARLELPDSSSFTFTTDNDSLTVKVTRLFTEAEVIDIVINQPVKGLKARAGLPDDHPFYIVEDADQRTKLADCCGTYFRYGAFGIRDARDGAWEMDTDGTPKVNMPKARGVHMDCIRECRNEELVKKDVIFMRAVEAGDASAQSTLSTEKQTLRDIPQTFDLTTDTPEQLKALWPTELPARE